MKSDIFVNIYDLVPFNSILYPIGMGFYHTGIEIHGREYTFAAESGIIDHTPKEDNPNGPFRESIYLGETNKNIGDIIYKLRTYFKNDNYNFITKNCNTFCEALCLEALRKTYSFLFYIDLQNVFIIINPKSFLYSLVPVIN